MRWFRTLVVALPVVLAGFAAAPANASVGIWTGGTNTGNHYTVSVVVETNVVQDLQLQVPSDEVCYSAAVTAENESESQTVGERGPIATVSDGEETVSVGSSDGVTVGGTDVEQTTISQQGCQTLP